MSEIVIRLDVGKMLDEHLREGAEVVEKQVVPRGYRCPECWENDGTHQATCVHRRNEIVDEP